MLDFVHSAAAYIIAIGVLVAFHEYGHFWAARRFGVRVLKFSVGFGRPLWQRRGRDGVEYVIAAIPLGGYVKLLDEREGPVPPEEQARAFNRQPIYARIAIFAAGPLFNFILAVVLFWATFVIGVPGLKPFVADPVPGSLAAAAGVHDGDRVLRANGQSIEGWTALRGALLHSALDHGVLNLQLQDRQGQQRQVSLDLSGARIDPQYLLDDVGLAPYQPPISTRIAGVLPNSPAQRAGILPGDELLSFDETPLSSFQVLQKLVSEHPGQAVTIGVLRNGETLHLRVVLADEVNGQIHRGKLGASAERMAKNDKLWQDLHTEERLSPLAAIPAACNEVLRETTMVVKLVYRMLTGEVSVKNLSGPITTAEAAGVAASIGLSTFLSFIAFVSVNVGFVNLLPVPVLDGGQIVNLLIEGAKGSPLSERTQIFVQQLGFALLMLMMGFAFFNDISRTIG